MLPLLLVPVPAAAPPAVRLALAWEQPQQAAQLLQRLPVPLLPLQQQLAPQPAPPPLVLQRGSAPWALHLPGGTQERGTGVITRRPLQRSSRRHVAVLENSKEARTCSSASTASVRRAARTAFKPVMGSPRCFSSSFRSATYKVCSTNAGEQPQHRQALLTRRAVGCGGLVRWDDWGASPWQLYLELGDPVGVAHSAAGEVICWWCLSTCSPVPLAVVVFCGNSQCAVGVR